MFIQEGFMTIRDDYPSDSPSVLNVKNGGVMCDTVCIVSCNGADVVRVILWDATFVQSVTAALPRISPSQGQRASRMET